MCPPLGPLGIPDLITVVILDTERKIIIIIMHIIVGSRLLSYRSNNIERRHKQVSETLVSTCRSTQRYNQEN
jgi:hypothetical protein